jgi:4-hydroxyphenylpyruvate dioxygenase
VGSALSQFPGQGQFDLENFLAQALLAGYPGPLSLEIFNDIFRETPNRRTAKDAMRSLLYLEGKVRSRLGLAAKQGGESASASTRVLERVELFDPPAATKLKGIAFLEFGVDEVSGRHLPRCSNVWGSAAREDTQPATLPYTAREASI